MKKLSLLAAFIFAFQNFYAVELPSTAQMDQNTPIQVETATHDQAAE